MVIAGSCGQQFPFPGCPLSVRSSTSGPSLPQQSCKVDSGSPKLTEEETTAGRNYLIVPTLNAVCLPRTIAGIKCISISQFLIMLIFIHPLKWSFKFYRWNGVSQGNYVHNVCFTVKSSEEVALSVLSAHAWCETAPLLGFLVLIHHCGAAAAPLCNSSARWPPNRGRECKEMQLVM